MASIVKGECEPNCFCCEDIPAGSLDEVHRDLSTGLPLPTQSLDAIETLWECHDGDLSGVTHETITHNATATTSAVTSTENGPDSSPGCLEFSIDANASADLFSAIHVVWTGQTFDAFSHKAHIAAGAVKAYATARPRQPSTFVAGEWAFIDLVWGACVKVDGKLFVWREYINTPGKFGNAVEHSHCWRARYAAEVPRVIDSTGLRGATVDELRQASLLVDPMANQDSHEVGLFFGMVARSNANNTSGDHRITYQFDTVSFYAQYDLGCIVAFVDKTDLTVSVPSQAFYNVEPVEMRGFSATLTKTALPAWDVNLHSRILQTHHDAGYSYVGSAVASNGVTVTVWYLPCNRITLSFDDGGPCPAWVNILHNDEFSDDACEDPEDFGFGDNANGIATAPTFAGFSLRDYYRPCATLAFNPALSTLWAGSDCAGHLNEPTIRNVDGILGQCHGKADPADPDPVCVHGLLPNQLDWMTNCYSLDPIAIGYRKRGKDAYGFGSLGGCGQTGGTPLCDAAPDGVDRLSTYCGITHLKSMGFTFPADGILGSNDHVSGLFYLDITE